MAWRQVLGSTEGGLDYGRCASTKICFTRANAEYGSRCPKSLAMPKGTLSSSYPSGV